MYTNTDQFLSKREDLCMMICNAEPDLILLTETIPKAQKLPIAPALLHISGYTLYPNFAPSTPNLGGSGIRGICVYVAQHLKVSEVVFEETAVEHVWVKLNLKGSDCLMIGCIYRSPSCNHEESIKHLKSLIQHASKVASHLMIVGDFNFPQIDWEAALSQAANSHSSHSFLEIIQDHFLFQHVRKPTRFRLGETPSVLDLILTTEEGMVRNLEHLPGLGRSDHVVLQFTLVCYAAADIPPPQYHTHTNYRLLAETLSSCNWMQVDNMELEDAHTFVTSCITKAVDACSKTRRAHSKKNIYMNRTAMQLRKRKKTLWNTYTQTHDVLDYARFVRCRNELRALTRKLRKDHERKLAGDLKQNPKAFWRYANSRLHTRSHIADLREESGKVATTNQAKADLLSTFFSSVFTVEDSITGTEIDQIFEGTALEDVDVSPQRVEEKLRVLRPNSAPGPDGIHPAGFENQRVRWQPP